MRRSSCFDLLSLPCRFRIGLAVAARYYVPLVNCSRLLLNLCKPFHLLINHLLTHLLTTIDGDIIDSFGHDRRGDGASEEAAAAAPAAAAAHGALEQ